MADSPLDKMVVSDEELMSAAKGGDMDAFGRLVQRHQGAAWGAAYRFLGNAHDADDVAQRAFMKILEAAPRYEPSASFKTYLYKVVTRLCIDHAEKQRPSTGGIQPAGARAAESPRLEAQERELEEAVRRALRGLPPRQRMAAVLRYCEGLSIRDAAEAMGTTEKAVERLLARARESLGDALSGFVAG